MSTAVKIVVVVVLLGLVGVLFFRRKKAKAAALAAITLQQSDRGPGTTIIPPPFGVVAPGLPYLQPPTSPASALVGGIGSPASGTWRSPQQMFVTAVDTLAPPPALATGPAVQERSGRGAF